MIRQRRKPLLQAARTPVPVHGLEANRAGAVDMYLRGIVVSFLLAGSRATQCLPCSPPFSCSSPRTPWWRHHQCTWRRQPLLHAHDRADLSSQRGRAQTSGSWCHGGRTRPTTRPTSCQPSTATAAPRTSFPRVGAWRPLRDLKPEKVLIWADVHIMVTEFDDHAQQ